MKVDIGNSKRVDATVRGSLPYRVELFREGDSIQAGCSCPYFEDRYETCKHIWATLLAAEAQGYLKGTGGGAPRDLVLVDHPGAMGDEWSEPPLPASRSRTRGGIDKPKSPPAAKPKQAAPAWKATLARLRSTMEKTQAAGPAGLAPGHEIVYVVDLPASLEGDALVFEVATRNRKRDGEWSKPKGRRFGTAEVAALADPADRQAMAMLAGGREQVTSYYGYYANNTYDTAPSRYKLSQTLGEAILPVLCPTGRCLARTADPNDGLRPLLWDDAGPWEFWLKVAPAATGKAYGLSGELRRGDESMALDAPRLLLSGGLVFWEDRVAPLRDFEAFDWIELLRRQGELPVPARQKDELIAELLRLPHQPRLDLPEDLRYEEVAIAPLPFLKVKKREPRGWSSATDDNWLVGELSLDYDGHILPATSPARSVYEPEKRRLLPRDPEAEQAYAARLDEIGFHRRSDYHRGETLELLARHLPKVARTLIQEGWRVEAEGKLYRQAAEFRIEVKSGIDWFEVHGGAEFDGEAVPLPTLLAALKRGDGLVTLGDGSFGLLPEDWLKKYGLLGQVGSEEGDHLRFRPTQVGLLDVLLAEQPEVRFDKRFERARERLRQFQGIAPADPPAGFEGELRGYQREGLGWLHFLREFGFGGCLADDMGLGKTVQVLALLESRRASRAATRKRNRPGPSLVVVPRSLIFNWKQEAARFTPKLRVLDYTGIGRGKPGESFDGYDVVLTTYGTLRRDIVDLKDQEFDYAILDEAQAIKNAGSQSAKAARLIRANHRLAMSGTPVENHLGELWSLMEFLNPGMLGKAAELGKADGGLRKPGEETRSLLARALRPFLLRRTKEQVAQDLPEKNEQTIYCDMEPAQRKLYDELREHYRHALLGRVEQQGIQKSKIQILEALLRLRQAACHPGLIDKAKRSGDPSAKLDALLPQLSEVVDGGHKSLVFSQFTSLLAIVKQRLDAEGIPYIYLDGRTRDRQARVQQFQEDPDCKVFLISLKAGGVGLNLTAADYVFLLDPWWNPAVEAQAIDRAHRIGQTRKVFAYRLIAKGTVEEKVLQLQADKRALADAIITADNSLIRDLGREDLELLLS
ncbi:SNF2-related protein (plasmid) [Tundrisphaera sp. TA3]|uniref:DEAD/DEAH box helicase n=1 Tax=Tundrisphaera sp. TA3 TaxID=3435775 RepID=UPI003EB7C592